MLERLEKDNPTLILELIFIRLSILSFLNEIKTTLLKPFVSLINLLSNLFSRNGLISMNIGYLFFEILRTSVKSGILKLLY